MSNKFDDPHPASSFERISKLVFDLEQELMMISNESAKVVALKDEMNHLKKLLSTVDKPQENLHHHLKATHSRLNDLLASLEGEALKDTPYLTELARILGFV